MNKKLAGCSLVENRWLEDSLCIRKKGGKEPKAEEEEEVKEKKKKKIYE